MTDVRLLRSSYRCYFDNLYKRIYIKLQYWISISEIARDLDGKRSTV